MVGHSRAAMGLLTGALLAAGCSALSDFGDYSFAAPGAEDAGAAGGGGSGAGGSGGGGEGGGAGGSGGGGGAGAACADDSDCDDGDGCNGRESCGADGRCADGDPFACETSTHPCRENACVNDAGTARCEERNANEGKRCAAGDGTSQPADTCARDYECVKGACEPQTIETCEPGQCRIRAGCDRTTGCVYTPRAATRSCDDADPCTVNDKCSGTDGTCSGAPKDCADAVACTDDACDGGNCVHTANDANCARACQDGICDALMDCQYTNQVDFTDCDDAGAATSPDFCYGGACLGGARSSPAASCAVGGCMCSGFQQTKDLEYMNSMYVGMIDATHTGGGGACTSGTVSIVYAVTPMALTYFTTDTAGGGAVAGTGSDLVSGYAIASDNVGVLDTSARSVDWIGNDLATALANGTPLITNFQGAARHSQGTLTSGTNHFWLWGDDTTTPSTGRVVRCSWSYCLLMGCVTTKSCVYETYATATTFAGVSPYVQSGGMVFSYTYAGAITAVNTDSGTPTKIVLADHDKNYLFDNPYERGDDAGTWVGSVVHANGKVLVYGYGATNLVYCDDGAYDGDPVCSALTGLPNQTSRSYYDATTNGAGDLLLLASSTCGGMICISFDYYIVVLPSGADAAVGSNWKEFHVGSSVLANGTFPARVAASTTSVMILGESVNTPYVWSWAP